MSGTRIRIEFELSGKIEAVLLFLSLGIDYSI